MHISSLGYYTSHLPAGPDFGLFILSDLGADSDFRSFKQVEKIITSD